MKINEFRFLKPNEEFIDLTYNNWSRCYEWGYVLDVALWEEFSTVHNACCGTTAFHESFATNLGIFVPNILNTDAFQSDEGVMFQNFKISDITEPYEGFFDLVVCVSTLEEIDKKDREKTLQNLYNQVNHGGRLIVTCDYPNVDIKILESFTGSDIEDVNERLNGRNSVYPNLEFEGLNIILLDITQDG